ncbi:hypothetical protein GQ457_01G054530 [Hibiscus cannabinus]
MSRSHRWVPLIANALILALVSTLECQNRDSTHATLEGQRIFRPPKAMNTQIGAELPRPWRNAAFVSRIGFSSVEGMRQIGCRRWRLKVGRLESLGIERWKRA